MTGIAVILLSIYLLSLLVVALCGLLWMVSRKFRRSLIGERVNPFAETGPLAKTGR